MLRRIIVTILLCSCLLDGRSVRAEVSVLQSSEAMADSAAGVADTLAMTARASGSTLDRSWIDRPAYAEFVGDAVRWSPLRGAAETTGDLANVPMLRGGIPLWRAAVNDTLMRGVELHRLLIQRVGARDSAAAESCAVALATLPGVWAWEGGNVAADLALARRDTSRALAVLGAPARTGGDPLAQAAGGLRRATLMLARRDTAAATASCRRIVRTWPALKPARDALATLDRLAVARGDSLVPEQERAAAEVEYWAGDRGAAIRRLQRVFPDRVQARGWETGFWLADLQRRARRFSDALATLDLTRRMAPGERPESRLSLERARVHRDAGRSDSAYALYAFVAGVPANGNDAEEALWELGREAEQHGDWSRARVAYAGVELLGRLPQDAALRLGFTWMASGDRARARACFMRANGDAARFWWAVAARDSSRPAADSVFTLLARRPGYTFYRACARETLRVRGRPAELQLARLAPASPGAPALIRRLVEAGLADDAARLAERWAGDDPSAGAPRGGVRSRPALLAEVARYTFAAGRVRPAIKLATRALEAVSSDTILAGSPDSIWSFVPELYPPHYDALIDSVARDRRIQVDPDLLRALVWKESHFDSAAVSRSGALGLTQLLPAAAADMARALHEPSPDGRALQQPETNLRLGARYLRWLLDRFGGNVPLTLAGYNAGPSVALRSPAEIGAGGEALLCELVAFPETQDYMKTILAVRQAYRELSPRMGRP